MGGWEMTGKSQGIGQLTLMSAVMTDGTFTLLSMSKIIPQVNCTWISSGSSDRRSLHYDSPNSEHEQKTFGGAKMYGVCRMWFDTWNDSLAIHHTNSNINKELPKKIRQNPHDLIVHIRRFSWHAEGVKCDSILHDTITTSQAPQNSFVLGAGIGISRSITFWSWSRWSFPLKVEDWWPFAPINHRDRKFSTWKICFHPPEIRGISLFFFKTFIFWCLFFVSKKR